MPRTAEAKAAAPARHVSRWLAVVIAGIAGATAINFYLIVAEVYVFHSATIIAISQWDASNALGLAAFNGGIATALLGLLMHVGVSTAWAAIFTALALRMPILVRYPFASGIIFGAVVMCVMILLIVPLGHAPHGNITLAGWVDRAIAHTLFFGVPVAWVTSRLGDGARIR